MNCVESCSPQVNTGSAMGVNRGSTGSFSGALECGGGSQEWLSRNLMVVKTTTNRAKWSDVDRRLDRGLSAPLFSVSEEGCVDVLARAG